MARQAKRIDKIRRILCKKSYNCLLEQDRQKRKQGQIILQKGFVFQENFPYFSMIFVLLLFKLPLIRSLQAMKIKMEVLRDHKG
jgi:hypothetical protein